MKVEYELLSRDHVTHQVRQVFADALGNGVIANHLAETLSIQHTIALSITLV